MILLTTRLIKVLLVALLLWFLLRKCALLKHSRTFCAGIAAALLAAACLAEFAASTVPPVTDGVTIIALGEKGENAKADEVFICGFTVDGTYYPTNSKTLKILDGKWFWGGSSYCWRNEADKRQPAGTTRSVTLAVPVGWERSISFESGEWRGLAEIRSGDLTETVDTSAVKSAELSKSCAGDLVWNQVRRLMAFAAVMLIVASGLQYVTQYTERAAAWGRKHKWHLIYAGIALAQFCFAIKYSGVISFWNDEMFEIGWSETAGSVFERMMVDAVPRPIFGFFFYFWYRISPYGEVWLLLPMEIATAVGIYLCGLCAKNIWDGKAGAFAASFVAVSSGTLTQLSYEIRSYPFYFCFGAALLLLDIKRWRHPGKETLLETVGACVVMTLFAGMHAHAVIICALLFCVDLYRYIRYKSKFCCFIPYFAAALSYIPVITVTLRNIQSGYFDVDHFWTPVPTFSMVLDLIKYLCVNSDIVTAFLLLTVAWLMICCISTHSAKISERSQIDISMESLLYLLLICAGHISVMYFYGNSRPQATLWYPRYFIGLLPMTCTLCACGASSLCDWLGGQRKEPQIRDTLAMFIILSLFFTGYVNLLPKQAPMNQRWREAADWLYTQRNAIYCEDTLVINPLWYYHPFAGWEEYYMNQEGRRDPVNVKRHVSAGDLAKYSRIYVVTFHGTTLSKELQAALDSQFSLVQSSKDVPVTEYVRK